MSNEHFAGRQFYHGTSTSSADGILAEGSKPRDGWYGPAFYVTEDPEVSDDYSKTHTHDGDEPAVLRGTVDAKNPLVLAGPQAVTKYLGSRNHMRLAHTARLAGHDFVQVGGSLAESLVLHPGGFAPKAVSGKKGWVDLT